MSPATSSKPAMNAKWYHGGMAGGMAACFTHPLDLIKVLLQTQQTGKLTIIGGTAEIVRKEGALALYNGLSASLLRQLSYSTTRFAIYEMVKQGTSGDMSFGEKVLLAGVSGACGGFVGTPADMVNVRMQNDVKLAAENRRNYKNAVHGLLQTFKFEGTKGLWSGAVMATARGGLMTIGQIGCYDQCKQVLLESGYFGDNLVTHFTASTTAGAIATTLTQPLDVLKTRMMNSKPGEYRGIWHCVQVTGELGPMGFFKGYVPAFVRLAPHTILMFVFFEQLKARFGSEVVKA